MQGLRELTLFGATRRHLAEVRASGTRLAAAMRAVATDRTAGAPERQITAHSSFEG